MDQEKKSPLFSIIIPTLGKTDLWIEAIHSVRAQSFTDWEIIAIDSGEEVFSLSLIERMDDKRIIYINTSKENPRLNWDTGYRRSSGRFILWLDDDNYLLPHALETLSSMIHTQGAQCDFVTANHVHWNDHFHPINRIRNHLVIPRRLFSGSVIDIDPDNAVRKLFGIPYDGPDIFARFHTSAQAIRREVVDSLIKKIGKIDFGSTSTHSLRIGALALSKRILFADIVIALIAQSGKSMSMLWPKESSSIKHVSYKYNLSEVSANTYINYVHENHLLLKKIFGQEMDKFSLPRTTFLNAYAQSLIYSDVSWRQLQNYWDQIYDKVKDSPEPELKSLKNKIPIYRALSIFGRILRFVGLYGHMQKLFTSFRKSSKDQILIDLAPYKVVSMKDCAEKLPIIIEKEMGMKYTNFLNGRY